MDLEPIAAISESLRAEIGKVIIGQEDTIDLMLVALLADGHLLLEGVPGTAKTLLAQSFAACLALQFGRIQFTPDLMPGDVIGTNLFDFRTNDFTLTKGPIFTQLLLADEINRTPPKTQAALLQAMQERTVTIDGEDHSLGKGFMVIATQNPVEQLGTYPLPEAQLDRFLFKHILAYPDRDEELAIVARHGKAAGRTQLQDVSLLQVADLPTILQLRRRVAEIRVAEDVVAYIVDIIRATRQHPSLEFGASPRAGAMMADAARALAALSGRDFVIPDDVKFLVAPVLRHRVVLAAGAQIEGARPDDILAQIVNQLDAPR